ncbi:MAG: glycerate kinase [Clostridia bacterium]|nr:glycerate kinase [Clostridia bacterium]
MKIVAAIDSFKGSLSTIQAGNAVRDGILRVYKDAEVIVSPLADGGEGTVDALTRGNPEGLLSVSVTGPIGIPVNAVYGTTDGGRTAIIEMASAAGITLVPEDRRNPLYTTTYGVGEMIADAIRRGCRNFIIGIGGSATNDCGIGMLSALGFSFLDENGQPVPYGADGVGRIRSIDRSGALPSLSECCFHVACDVKNPLCGENGCSAVYGPQKGATPEIIRQMDDHLRAFAHLTAEVIGRDCSDIPGAGAAGGLGFAFLSYLGASLEPGITIVIRETHLEEEIRSADFVVTGEGRLDEQTCMGKAPAGVAAIAAKYGVPVIAFSGCVTDGARILPDHGIHAHFPILRRPCTLEEAMDPNTAYQNLADTAEQVFRLIRATRT